MDETITVSLADLRLLLQSFGTNEQTDVQFEAWWRLVTQVDARDAEGTEDA